MEVRGGFRVWGWDGFLEGTCGEHDEIADDHRHKCPRETHAKHEDRAGHGAGDDHGKAEPNQGDRERAAARTHRHGFVLVLVSQEMIDLVLGDVKVIDHGAWLRHATVHNPASFNEWGVAGHVLMSRSLTQRRQRSSRSLVL